MVGAPPVAVGGSTPAESEAVAAAHAALTAPSVSANASVFSHPLGAGPPVGRRGATKIKVKPWYKRKPAASACKRGVANRPVLP
jgi:hypothetical protein